MNITFYDANEKKVFDTPNDAGFSPVLDSQKDWKAKKGLNSIDAGVIPFQNVNLDIGETYSICIDDSEWRKVKVESISNESIVIKNI